MKLISIEKCEEQCTEAVVNSQGILLPLKFAQELKDVCERNIQVLMKRSSDKMNNLVRDDLPIGPFFNPDNPAVVHVHLVLSTDGVSIIRSSGQELYPCWATVGDLPPKLRFSFSNLVLCSLWFGFGKLDFNSVFNILKSELRRSVYLQINNRLCHVIFNVIVTTADSPARAAILNMIQYNGYFGCHLCDEPGKRVSRGKCIYPVNRPITMRTSESYHQCLNRALSLSQQGKNPNSKKNRYLTRVTK